MLDGTLCSIDSLPAQTGVEIEVDGDRLRVRAHTIDPPERFSLWSGWFLMSECPIAIRWAAFDWGDDP